MFIREFCKLSEADIKAIRGVEQVCKDHDGLRGDIFLDPSLNFDPGIKNAFLLFDAERLICVLCMFIPTGQEAEIQAYTLPEYRRRGYYRLLLEKAEAELRRFGIPEMLLVCESYCTPGRLAAAALQAVHEHSEHFMRLTLDAAESFRGEPDKLHVHLAGREELPDLVHLSRRIFADSPEDALHYISKTLDLQAREQYAAMIGGEYVGIGAVSLETGEASIFGLGILPEQRGKGLGAAMVRALISNLLRRGIRHITLEVDSKNLPALNLYKKCGFEVVTTFDYHHKKVGPIPEFTNPAIFVRKDSTDPPS